MEGLKGEPEDAFRFYKLILACIGIRPLSNNRWLVLLCHFTFFFVLGTVNLYSALLVRGAVLYMKDHFTNRVYGLCYALGCCVANVKWLTFKLRLKDLELFMRELSPAGDTVLCKTVSLFERCFAFVPLVILLTGVVGSVSSGAFVKPLPYPDQGRTSTLREYFPILTLYLVTAFTHCCVHELSHLTILKVSNQLSNRVQLLYERISKVTRENINKTESFKAIVTEHVHLLRLSNLLQDFYKNPLWAQLGMAVSCPLLCLVSLSKMLDDGAYDDLPFLGLMQIIFFTDFFIYCFSGELLKKHFESLHYAAYSSDWVHLDLPDRRSILIIQTISSKEYKFMAAKVIPLSFATFETVCRQVFSLLTFSYQVVQG